MSIVVKTVDLEKEYRLGEVVVHALGGVSMELKKGEFVVVAGPRVLGKLLFLISLAH